MQSREEFRFLLICAVISAVISAVALLVFSYFIIHAFLSGTTIILGVLVSLVSGLIIAFSISLYFRLGSEVTLLGVEEVYSVIRYFRKIRGGDFTGQVSDTNINTGAGRDVIEFGKFHETISQLFSDTSRLSRDLGHLSKDILSQAVKLSGSADDQSRSVEETGLSLVRIGESIEDVGRSVDDLRSLSQEVSSSTLEMMGNVEKVSKSANNLSHFVGEVVSAIQEIVGNIKSVAQSTDSLSAAAGQTTNVMQDIDHSTQAIRSRADGAARLVDVTLESMARTREALNLTVEGTRKLAATVNEAQATMQALGEQSEAIGNILVVISSIASETHLLSLNASIMAAKAGEHGKGFMVVASEIKNLALRTAESTKQIESMIQQTRGGIAAGISAIEEGTSQAVEGVRLAENAEEALKTMLEQVSVVADNTREIASSTEQQAKLSRQVYQATGEVAERTEQIKTAMREQQDNSQYLNQRARQMSELTDQVSRATEEQAHSSKQIAKAMEDLTGSVESIHRATEAQSDSSREIMEAVSFIRKQADLVAIAAQNVSQTAMSVLHQALLLSHPLKGFKLPEAKTTMRIGLLLDNLREERWVRERKMFIARAANLGAEVIDLVAGGDARKQQAQAEEVFKIGVDLIVVVCVDAEAAAKIVNTAHQLHIPAIAYDRLIRNCDLELFITFDASVIGDMHVQYLIKRVPRGKYVMICGSPSDSNAVMIHEGQMKALKPYLDSGKVELVSKEWVPDWEPRVAYQKMKEVLSRVQFKVDAVMVANDGMAGGVIKALEEAGMAGRIPVTGMDTELTACQRIVKGTQSMTIYMPIRLQAAMAAEAAVLMIQGEQIPGLDRTVNNGKMNAPSILLRPIKVDKENLRETVIADGFHAEKDVFGK